MTGQYCGQWLLASFFILSSLPAGAIDPSGNIHGPGGPTGDIAGTVTDSVTKLPVPNLTVEAFNSQGEFFDDGTTGTDGTYRITGLAVGDYVIRAGTSSPYFIELYQDLRCPSGGNSCDYANGTRVTVVPDQEASGIDFTLDPAGIITGTVTDSGTGLGVPSMLLEIFDSQGSSAGFGFTNSTGEYEAPRLTTGNYFVRTASTFYHNELYQDLPCADGCDVTTGTPISVTEGSTTPDINFSLDPGGVISGTVTDSMSGLGLPSVSISVVDDQGFFVGSGFTDGDGAYRVSDLGLGDHFIKTSNASASGYLDELHLNVPCPFFCDATTGTPVPVSVNAPTAEINFELDLGGEITGNVTDSDGANPLPNVSVRAFDDQGGTVRTGFTDVNGDFRIRGMVTGDYFLRTSSFTFLDELYEEIPCTDSSCIVTDGTAVPVTTGETTSGIDFTLEQGGEISGTITDSNATPLLDITVFAFDSQGESAGSSAFTDSKGEYTVTGLATGNYYLRALSVEYVDELYQDIPCIGPSCVVTDGTPVPATAGESTKNIDFSLEVGGEITGRITESATGDPVDQVIVDVHDDQGSRVAQAFTDSAGLYRIAGLLSGDYFVAAEPDPVLGSPLGKMLYMAIICAPGCDVTAGTPVSVTLPDTTKGIDFALLPSEVIFIGNFD